MMSKTLSLMLCALGVSIPAPWGFSTDRSSLTRSFDTTSATTNAPIVVTATFTNGSGLASRGFFYSEQIPSGLFVTALDLRLNGQSVTNYTFASATDSDVYPGLRPYRWVLEHPTGFTETNPVPANATVLIRYSITSPVVGSFSLQQFSWAGYDPTHTNASFGYSEISDAQSVSFVAPSPWPDATDLGGGWKRSSWFGDFNVTYYPWIYHAQHGWMYTFGTDPTSIWLWTTDLGFLWTGSGVYSWLWSDTKHTWLYYVKGSHSPRYFFNWNTQTWEAHNP